MPDRSLDEFLNVEDGADTEDERAAHSDAERENDAEESGDGGDGTGEVGDAADDGDGGGSRTGDEATARTDAGPATPTYRWSPEGASCPRCGETVEKRWRDGDAFVCFDCKEW